MCIDTAYDPLLPNSNFLKADQCSAQDPSVLWNGRDGPTITLAATGLTARVTGGLLHAVAARLDPSSVLTYIRADRKHAASLSLFLWSFFLTTIKIFSKLLVLTS